MKEKKRWKHAAASLVFFVLLVSCGKFFRYILADDTSSYTRITFHEMYEQDNIDVLFAGSSHCYRSFYPKIFDEAFGVNSYNAGTSSQNLDGSYMVIREAARYNDLKQVYLELYYELAFETYKMRTDLTQTYIISDYLKPSVDKIQYLLDASASEHYFNSFILARRNWQKFFDADYIKNLIIKKQTDSYKDFKYTKDADETEWYEGKGYVASRGAAEHGKYFSEKGWEKISIDKISKDWRKRLRDIIDFCHKKDIRLTLVVAPMADFLLSSIGNYDDYVELMREIAAENHIDYYDFNLCREEYFPGDAALFKDTHHLNCDGAEVFSSLFADFINGKIAESDLFYRSYHEKMDALKTEVLGISYADSSQDNGRTVRKCKIVAAGSDKLEYRIILEPNEGESRVCQEFSDNRYFMIHPEEHGVCKIDYRLKCFDGEVKTMNISY